MMRAMTATVLAAAAVVAVTPPPATAVVHEIYGAWCAGKGEIEPPGLSDPTKKNFGQPVVAGGVVAFTPYLDGVLIDFDFEKAQAKVVAAPTGPAIHPRSRIRRLPALRQPGEVGWLDDRPTLAQVDQVSLPPIASVLAQTVENSCPGSGSERESGLRMSVVTASVKAWTVTSSTSKRRPSWPP
jgi:hypothetical protein